MKAIFINNEISEAGYYSLCAWFFVPLEDTSSDPLNFVLFNFDILQHGHEFSPFLREELIE